MDVHQCKWWILIQFSPGFFLGCSVDNKSAHCSGDKPLPERIIDKFYHAIWRHWVKLNQGSCKVRSDTLRPRQNGSQFPDDISKGIFLNENVWIAIQISLKVVPNGTINNIPALGQIMAWRLPGDEPLSEPIVVSLPTHICVLRPQWVNMSTVWGQLFFKTALVELQGWYIIKINSLRQRQNGRHFADDIFKCIFLNENVWIPITISLKFVLKDPINNIPALVQIMAWRRPGDKPLSEPMMVRFPTHICVTRPQWVKCKKNLHLITCNLYI